MIYRKRSIPFSDHLGEVFTGDVLHHQELTVSLGEVVANTWQRRMMQPGQESRFAFELFSQAFIGEEGLFQGYCGVEPFIDCLEHSTHAALA